MNKEYFIPKNVFKGTDSNGNSYRFEEWDFSTLATMETFGFIFYMIIIFAFGSIAAPLLLLLFLISIGTSGRFIYLITGLISTYVLYDFANGWLCLISASFFLSDKYLNYVMNANIITLLVSVVFIIFGGLLDKFVFKPVSNLTEDEFNKLNSTKQRELHKEIEIKKTYVIILIYILCLIGILIGTHIQNENKDWVKTNIEKVE